MGIGARCKCCSYCACNLVSTAACSNIVCKQCAEAMSCCMAHLRKRVPILLVLVAARHVPQLHFDLLVVYAAANLLHPAKQPESLSKWMQLMLTAHDGYSR